MASFTGFTSKVLSIAKKAAPIGGVARAWLGDPLRASGGDWAQAIQWILGRVKKFKFADPIKTTMMAMRYPAYPIMEGAVGTIGGWIAEEILGGMDFKGSGHIKSLATIWKNYSISALINGIIAGYVYLAPFNPGEDNPGGGGYTEGYDRPTVEPAGFGDTAYRTRASAHIRNSAGQNLAMPS